ncbi:hypothetical protein F5J12DRAFT_782825 [Pisolithus orientalis]|uniref:uncharacterized protein n=1 Tax=Pisolithus orientalis TaxID=936130 RepID=UPI0022251377|nr:uncharacterized protein F5J12DRAFT_782825 [Pisolithus orientalis]KAI6006556.1 hypothetical protein F5J12DRAFT_782825 [Pisolithus orientalis]
MCWPLHATSFCSALVITTPCLLLLCHAVMLRWSLPLVLTTPVIHPAFGAMAYHVSTMCWELLLCATLIPMLWGQLIGWLNLCWPMSHNQLSTSTGHVTWPNWVHGLKPKDDGEVVKEVFLPSQKMEVTRSHALHMVVGVNGHMATCICTYSHCVYNTEHVLSASTVVPSQIPIQGAHVNFLRKLTDVKNIDLLIFLVKSKSGT